MRLSSLIAVLAACALASAGCVRRVIDITSDPSGATVWLNDRELGRTPCSAEFTYYGTYDVRLHREGYEPIHGSAEAKAPWWDVIGFDLVSEALPAKLVSQTEWHFTLEETSRDQATLLERARELRAHTEGDEPAATEAPAPDR